LLLACSCPTLPALALDFKGIAIGDRFDPAAIKQKFPPSARAPAGMTCTQTVCRGIVDAGIATGELSVSADPYGRVDSLSFEFPLNAFDAFAQSLAAKFGKPASSTAMQMQNGFGATFDSRKMTWLEDGHLAALDEQRERLGRNKAIFFIKRASRAAPQRGGS
jgi:hypothetical protein